MEESSYACNYRPCCRGRLPCLQRSREGRTSRADEPESDARRADTSERPVLSRRSKLHYQPTAHDDGGGRPACLERHGGR